METRIRKVNRLFLWTVLVTIGAGFVIGIISRFVTDMGFQLLINQGILFLPALIYLCLQPEGFCETVGLRRVPWGTVPLYILEMITLIPLVSLVNLISMFFVKNEIADTMDTILEHHSVFFAVLIVAVVPAIIEELIFRGIIYNHGYRKVNPAGGMLLCGLLFGMLHMNFNQFAYAFVLGAALCLVYEASNSIVSTMIMHFTLNAYSTVMLFATKMLVGNEALEQFLGDMESTETTTEDLMAALPSIAIFAACGVALAYVILRAIAKKCGRYEYLKSLFKKPEPTTWEAVEYVEEKPSLITPAAIIGIILCVGMMILTQLLSSMGLN